MAALASMIVQSPLQHVALARTLIIYAAFFGLAWFLWSFFQHRKRMRSLPGPPHSWLWGHLKLVGELQKDYPSDIHGQWYPTLLQRKYNLPSVFYLDFWPIQPQFCLITDPRISEQVATRPKHPELRRFTDDTMGKYNLVSIEGQVWKKWRGVFNPGFAASHLLTLTGVVVEETQVFLGLLAKHARQENVVRVERLCTNLTVDVIGRVILDLKFNWQTSKENEYLRNFMNLFNIYPFGPYYGNDWSPLYHIRLWWYKRNMRRYLSRVLRNRFTSSREQQDTDKPTARKRNVMDLALESYNKEQKASTGQLQQQSKLDPDFEKYAIDAMNAFIFGGHDTTATTIAYALYHLSKDARATATMIREHNDIFGADPDAVPDLLRTQPYLLNKLDYTLAVIKEILRLYPPASSLRAGGPDFHLHDPATNTSYPTYTDMPIWLNGVLHHRSSTNFIDPDAFIPDRFLSPSSPYYSTFHLNNPSSTTNPPTNALHTFPDGAWRPFERGPRNCIGQEFALIEARIVLVMTVRRWEVVPAYAESDSAVDDGSTWRAPGKGEKRTVLGEEAYQVLKASGKPALGLPCRIRAREEKVVGREAG